MSKKLQRTYANALFLQRRRKKITSKSASMRIQFNARIIKHFQSYLIPLFGRALYYDRSCSAHGTSKVQSSSLPYTIIQGLLKYQVSIFPSCGNMKENAFRVVGLLIHRRGQSVIRKLTLTRSSIVRYVPFLKLEYTKPRSRQFILKRRNALLGFDTLGVYSSQC